MGSKLILGQNTAYPESYDPGLLFPVARNETREPMGFAGDLPFHGSDWWNAYELSWLDGRGKPRVAVGEIHVPATSPNLVESKSLKLYLNSLNQCRYESDQQVTELISADLERAAGAPVTVQICRADQWRPVAGLPGSCIDDLDVSIQHYQPNPELLATLDGEVRETLHSHLLKTNCPVTGQPDWGSVVISYAGPRIDPASLLPYLVSFRGHDGFHENCVEQIFVDLLRRCGPAELSVQGFYTRRGGLDINPFRSNVSGATPLMQRSWRQ